MTYHARVTAEGHVVFPDDLAAELQLIPGSLLEIERDQGKLVLKSYAQVVQEVQARFHAMMPPGQEGIVDVLIADRREEARRENAKHEEWLKRQPNS